MKYPVWKWTAPIKFTNNYTIHICKHYTYIGIYFFGANWHLQITLSVRCSSEHWFYKKIHVVKCKYQPLRNYDIPTDPNHPTNRRTLGFIVEVAQASHHQWLAKSECLPILLLLLIIIIKKNTLSYTNMFPGTHNKRDRQLDPKTFYVLTHFGIMFINWVWWAAPPPSHWWWFGWRQSESF